MTTLYATYCSAPKRDDPGQLPAIERYRSQRIARAAHEASQEGARFGILSGTYGLIGPKEPLPWYDHLLQEDEIAPMVPGVAERLRAWAVTEIVWFTVDPALDAFVSRYAAVLERAAKSVAIPMETRIVVAND
jgi:hypothetical protein